MNVAKHIRTLLPKEYHNQTGIYKIYFYENKVYIGSTTESFSSRLRRHLHSLVKKNHYNTYLQNSFNKYGIENFKIEIIEVIPKTKNILEKEQYWIDFYDSYNNGYNILPKAANSKGFKMYEYVLEKRRIKILQYSLEGFFIKEWKSRTEVTNKFGAINNESLKNGHAQGFQWRYWSENYPLIINKYKNSTAYILYQYDLQGNFIKEWESMLKASQELKIPCGNISKHLKGKIKVCYGYIFKRNKEFTEKYEKTHPFTKQIKITCLKTGKIEYFKTKREVERLLKISRCSMTNAIKKYNGIMIKKQLKIEEICTV